MRRLLLAALAPLLFAVPAQAASAAPLTVLVKGAGVITGPNGFSCDKSTNFDERATVDCPGLDIKPGDSVSLTATPGGTPAGDWTFDRWAGCDSVVKNTCNVTVAIGGQNVGVAFADAKPPDVEHADLPAVIGSHFAPDLRSADPTATIACRLDGGAAIADCAGMTWNLGDGRHVLDYSATDPSGNETDGEITLTVDATPPIVTFSGLAEGQRTNASPVTVGWTLDDATAKITGCTIDGTAPAACGSPATFPGLDDGAHTLTVTAGDGLNVATYTRHFTLDTKPPVITMTGGPAAGASTGASVAFRFTLDEPAIINCRIDSGAPTACIGGMNYDRLAEGRHTFTVQASDGLNPMSEITRVFTVDVTAPETAIDGGPDGGMRFSSEPGASFECSLDNAGFAPCASPVAVPADGTHTFLVRARDATGNVDPTPAAKTWSPTAVPAVGAAPAPAPAPATAPAPARAKAVAPHCSAKLRKLTKRGARITVTCSAPTRATITLKRGAKRLAHATLNVANPVTTTLKLKVKVSARRLRIVTTP